MRNRCIPDTILGYHIEILPVRWGEKENKYYVSKKQQQEKSYGHQMRCGKEKRSNELEGNIQACIGSEGLFQTLAFELQLKQHKGHRQRTSERAKPWEEMRSSGRRSSRELPQQRPGKWKEGRAPLRVLGFILNTIGEMATAALCRRDPRALEWWQQHLRGRKGQRAVKERTVRSTHKH